MYFCLASVQLKYTFLKDLIVILTRIRIPAPYSTNAEMLILCSLFENEPHKK